MCSAAMTFSSMAMQCLSSPSGAVTTHYMRVFGTAVLLALSVALVACGAAGQLLPIESDRNVFFAGQLAVSLTAAKTVPKREFETYAVD